MTRRGNDRAELGAIPAATHRTPRDKDAGAQDMTSRTVLNAQEISDVLKVLGNPTRVQIMQRLKQPSVGFPQCQPLLGRQDIGVCASHIQEELSLAPSTASDYLGKLHRTSLLISTRVGKRTYFRRNEERISQVVDAIGTLL